MEKQDSYLKQLLSTKINETKGTRGEKVHRTNQRLDIIDFDLPTINVGQTATPEYYKYIQTMLQAYDRYLGYASGITANNVLLTLSEGVRLYTAMKMIKRYYDAQDVTFPSGEKVHEIFSKTQVISVDREGNYAPTIQDRIDNSCKGVSNKLWVTEYINKVEQVLLPQGIMKFYDYYLSNLFDVSNTDNKEALTVIRFWVSDESTNFVSCYTNDASGASTTKLTKTNFDGMFNSLESYLTPTMRNFVTTFLGWDKPNEDWTRDLQGNTLSIARDTKLISTLNNIEPEKCKVIMQEGVNPNKGAWTGSVGNLWQRYYYDFEQLFDNTDEDEVIPSTLYFGIDGLSLEQVMLSGHDILNTINIDYYNYLFMCVLCNEETVYPRELYAGGINSVMTSINCTTGAFFPTLYTEINDVKQFCYGNDISLKLYNFKINATTVAHEFVNNAYPTVDTLGGIIGDYGEQGDSRDQLAIFQFPVIVHERWRYAQRWTEMANKKLVKEETAETEDSNGEAKELRDADYFPEVMVNPLIEVLIDANWEDEWTATDQATSVNHFVSHASDKVAFNTYVLDPKEAELSIHTTMFKLLTGYRTYNEAITFIDNMFSGKQQESN